MLGSEIQVKCFVFGVKNLLYFEKYIIIILKHSYVPSAMLHHLEIFRVNVDRRCVPDFNKCEREREEKRNGFDLLINYQFEWSKLKLNLKQVVCYIYRYFVCRYLLMWQIIVILKPLGPLFFLFIDLSSNDSEKKKFFFFT